MTNCKEAAEYYRRKEIELKNCPFCGKKIKRYSIGTANGYVYELKISCCMEFDITSDEPMFADARRPYMVGLDAVEKWNRRAGEQK